MGRVDPVPQSQFGGESIVHSAGFFLGVTLGKTNVQAVSDDFQKAILIDEIGIQGGIHQGLPVIRSGLECQPESRLITAARLLGAFEKEFDEGWGGH
jgi:hypothetical protein